MLSGILPFSPRFADEWGMSLSSPIKKQTQIFLKPKSLIFGKWHQRGSAVGFTGRGSRAQPPGKPVAFPEQAVRGAGPGLQPRPPLSLLFTAGRQGRSRPPGTQPGSALRSCYRHSLGRNVCGLQPSQPQTRPQTASTFPLIVTV